MSATNSITYAGHSSVFVEIGGKRVAIDPWLKGNPSCPESLHSPEAVDLIVLSHGHSDHTGDAVRLALECKSALAATYELAMIMVAEGVPQDQVIPMNKGGSVKFGELTVRLTHAMHSSSYDSKTGTVYAGEACGIILSSDSWCVYHAGDTALFSDMKVIGDTHHPDVALLPIGDRFTMGPKEAAAAASWLECGVAIPIHYKTFPLLTGTYEEFSKECALLGVESIELPPGESLRGRGIV
jgi:L-ascorbate metabolism protein UlaG (beta-lactamase superfamily)